MAPNPEKIGAGLDERQRVLIHACSLNRSDIIKKVVRTAPKSGSSNGGYGDRDVDREVLDHMDEEGLTALHHAVKKSSLDVSYQADFDCSISTTALRLCLRVAGNMVSSVVCSRRMIGTMPPSSRTGGHPAHTL